MSANVLKRSLAEHLFNESTDERTYKFIVNIRQQRQRATDVSSRERARLQQEREQSCLYRVRAINIQSLSV